MSEQCVPDVFNELFVECGEKRHVKVMIRPVCEENLPFVISEAKFELVYYNGKIETSGQCQIVGHELDAFISPEQKGEYVLRFIYEISDETWIDDIKLRVR